MILEILKQISLGIFFIYQDLKIPLKTKNI